MRRPQNLKISPPFLKLLSNASACQGYLALLATICKSPMRFASLVNMKTILSVCLVISLKFIYCEKTTKFEYVSSFSLKLLSNVITKWAWPIFLLFSGARHVHSIVSLCYKQNTIFFSNSSGRGIAQKILGERILCPTPPPPSELPLFECAQCRY